LFFSTHSAPPAISTLSLHDALPIFRRLRADDVAAEQLAVLLLADELHKALAIAVHGARANRAVLHLADDDVMALLASLGLGQAEDRKSTRLNSSHDQISYAVFCLKK